MFRSKRAQSERLGTGGRPVKPKGRSTRLNLGRRGASTTEVSTSRFKVPKGVMKFVSADESIHSTYGESNKNGTNTDSEEDLSNRSIKFKEIQIREYARTIGDNPSCSSGPPIGISWEYDPSTKVLTIDEYEDSRPERRTHFEMVLPRKVRTEMLKSWDVSRSEIANAVRTSIKIKNQRRTTVNNLSKSGAEEAMEKTGRKLMRGLLLKPSTGKQVAELERQYELAEKQRKQLMLQHQMSGESEDYDKEEEAQEEKRRPIIVAEEEDDDDDDASPTEEYEDDEINNKVNNEEENVQVKVTNFASAAANKTTPTTSTSTTTDDENKTGSNSSSSDASLQSKGEDTAQIHPPTDQQHHPEEVEC